MKKQKLVILYGGFSDEREVSLKSGKAVSDNIDLDRYEPILVDVLSTDNFKEVNTSNVYTFDEIILRYKNAVFMIALHGEFGEDGVLQYLLERSDVKFTGSRFNAHSIAINKLATKLIAQDLGIKCARHISFSSQKVVKLENLPDFDMFVVKPNSSGSSVGVSIEKTKQDTLLKIKNLLKIYSTVLVEEYIKGDEVDCAVIGDSVFPLALIKPIKGHLFFDYDAKYTKEECDEVIPAPINKTIENQVKESSIKIHKALGCKGVTRSEYIIKNNEPYFLEINTTPGMTETSLVPQQASADGVTFSELIDRLIDEA
ncbi:MAG: D-alanine--D-alanine ligase [bacterium]|nr:D-alanine--D-alanine ligase [bacterium]